MQQRSSVIRQWKSRLLAGVVLAALVTTHVVSAHVGVNPGSVPPDSFQTFTIRVPTEKDEPTISVRVEFPAGLTVSRFLTKTGWTREVEKDSAGRIVAASWSGGQIAPEEYEGFGFNARTPAEEGPLVFKAYQTYQGGETVEWVNAEGEDNPAPVVQVQAAMGSDGAAAAHTDAATGASSATGAPEVAGVSASGSNAPAGDTSTATRGEASDLPVFASLGAVVVAFVALALSGVALTRRRTAA